MFKIRKEKIIPPEKDTKVILFEEEHMATIKFILQKLNLAVYDLKYEYPKNTEKNVNQINLLLERFGELIKN